MITITSRSSASNTGITRYLVGGHELLSQTAIDGLTKFALACSENADANASENATLKVTGFIEPDLPSNKNTQAYYQGSAYFEGVSRQVKYWRHKHWAQIDVDATPICLVDLENSHIHVLNQDPLGLGLNFEVLTGPALIILLAQRSVYCLHAASVDTMVGRIAIMAESGSGKSTLSAHGGEKWQQVCDDIMPITFDDSSLKTMVLPDFPQLKLQDKTVHGFPMPAAALDYIVRINPEPSNQVNFAILPKAHAMLELIRHTVASKLFSQRQLQAQLLFAKKVSSEIPVIEVSYPRDLNKLAELRFSITEYIQSLNLEKIK